MIIWSGCLHKHQLEAAQRLAINNLYGTKLRHPDHRTIIKVDKGLFWLQTSVQAFLTNA